MPLKVQLPSLAIWKRPRSVCCAGWRSPPVQEAVFEGVLDGDGVVGIELGEDEVSGVADSGEAGAGGFCVAEVINGDVNGGSVVSACEGGLGAVASREVAMPSETEMS